MDTVKTFNPNLIHCFRVCHSQALNLKLQQGMALWERPNAHRMSVAIVIIVGIQEIETFLLNAPNAVVMEPLKQVLGEYYYFYS